MPGKRLSSQSGTLSDLVEIPLGLEGMAAFKLTTIGQALLTKGTTEDREVRYAGTRYE